MCDPPSRRSMAPGAGSRGGGPAMPATHGRRIGAAVAIGAASLALAATALGGGARHGTVSGRNGAIVYQATVGAHVQLFTVRPDGSAVRQLTRYRDSDAVHAAWSPDGRTLVFERDLPNSARIYSMRFDGTQRRVLRASGLQGFPAYSPDGRTIVFDRTLPDEDALWLMD